MLCLKVTNSLEISADAIILINVVRYWESLRLTKLMLLKKMCFSPLAEEPENVMAEKRL